MALIFDLVRDEGETVVFTSHSIDPALRSGDRVLGVAQGRLQRDAPARDLKPSNVRGLYD